jgi:hypothetical protein
MRVPLFKPAGWMPECGTGIPACPEADGVEPDGMAEPDGTAEPGGTEAPEGMATPGGTGRNACPTFAGETTGRFRMSATVRRVRATFEGAPG